MFRGKNETFQQYFFQGSSFFLIRSSGMFETKDDAHKLYPHVFSPIGLFCYLTFDSAKRNRQKAGVGTGKELMGSLPSFFFVVDGGLLYALHTTV